MGKADERQTQDERTIEREPAEDVREEFTTYRETGEGEGRAEEAGARREADLQPSPPREGESSEKA
jgi:hypothetical protein